MISVPNRFSVYSPRFQGTLWMNLSRDPRPLQERLAQGVQEWETAFANGQYLALEEEFVREKASAANLHELTTLLQEAYASVTETPRHLPRIRINRSQTQASLNYGHQ